MLPDAPAVETPSVDTPPTILVHVTSTAASGTIRDSSIISAVYVIVIDPVSTIVAISISNCATVLLSTNPVIPDELTIVTLPRLFILAGSKSRMFNSYAVSPDVLPNVIWYVAVPAKTLITLLSSAVIAGSTTLILTSVTPAAE